VGAAVTAHADPAASLVIIDDRPDLHVLMGRRLTTLRFAPGMIVFPGGAVEPGDFETAETLSMINVDVPGMKRADAAANLYAALRETHEEAGVWLGGESPIDARRFPYVGHWITPESSPRRFDTRFFLARFSGGDVRVDRDEFEDLWWARPIEILKRVESGELSAITPTLSFLTSLTQYRNVDKAFAGTRRGIARRFLRDSVYF
jgi:8-oxo-dGTP pyrophosphatase MutT (NUDIX family)